MNFKVLAIFLVAVIAVAKTDDQVNFNWAGKID